MKDKLYSDILVWKFIDERERERERERGFNKFIFPTCKYINEKTTYFSKIASQSAYGARILFERIFTRIRPTPSYPKMAKPKNSLW